MSTTLPGPAFNRAEPIPGYRTQERLGAGGYGEVWKAEAPGGIAKAIKIVYGWHDGDRALRELSSLNRIKEVRHPFLLSLERIELIDGHLVIVAELANSSLKNLCDEYREAGNSGIPRDELLTHLRDAADALDYICEKHSLQHLDVKPENLLLVGGRVKVADFGLVKDLQEVNCSLVGGLTPVYAAPELFDGRPNIHSDQYSLAIVYQEMLTGMLPFSGRTTAQLAAQHLHSRPRLDRLPAWDQATIAKALSKDSNQRFRNCREMVDSLLAAGIGSRARSAGPAGGVRGALPTAMPAMQTEMLAWDEGSLGGVRSSRATPQILAPAPAVVNLPPLESTPEETTFRPTIFVGVGGLAARTLQLLQRRLADRFGDIRSVPALQMILLETDTEALKQATAQDNPASLNNDAAVLLRLRQPADYRREPGRHQKWLSRRWIFNIPRSLQTQGFRPLGRLALVDHSERVIERLRRTIAAAVQPEAIAASSQHTGLPFRAGAPRVFVVSSMTGGAGSGMVFDVAYLVRHVLRDMKLSDDDVCGILAHCTGHQTQSNDLAVANSYACLTELNHYSDLRSACPADPEGGLPACDPQVAPFNHAYVVHLGEGLDPQHFATATDNLAAYLYCNSVTAAAGFFDACRGVPSSGEPSASVSPTVRTFGISQLGLCHDDVPVPAVGDLCCALIKRWREPEGAGSPEQTTSLADPSSLLAQQFISSATDEQLQADVIEQAKNAGLADIKPLIDQFYARATEAMGSDPNAYLAKVLQELVNKSDTRGGLWNRLPDSESIIDSLDRLIRSQGLQNSPGSCLELVLEGHLTEFAAARATALCQWILSLVSKPQCRLAGAQRAAEYLAQQLQPLSRHASDRLQSRRQDLVAREQALRNATGAGAKWLKFRGFGPRRRLVVDERLSQYFQLRIEDLILNGICRLIGLILADVAALDDKLRNLSADLNRLAEEFQRLPTSPPAGSASAASETSEKARELVTRTITSQKGRLAAEMERELEPELLRIFNMEEGEVRGRLPGVMVRAAHSTILRSLKGASLLEIVSAAEGTADARFSFGAGLKSAEPTFSQCGGARRLLVMAPAGFPANELTAKSSQEGTAEPTIVADGGHDVIVCYETEHLSLPHVAAAVLDQRLQYVEVASRLQTRADVSWTPL
jgi:hypothetical protein